MSGRAITTHRHTCIDRRKVGHTTAPDLCWRVFLVLWIHASLRALVLDHAPCTCLDHAYARTPEVSSEAALLKFYAPRWQWGVSQLSRAVVGSISHAHFKRAWQKLRQCQGEVKHGVGKPIPRGLGSSFASNTPLASLYVCPPMVFPPPGSSRDPACSHRPTDPTTARPCDRPAVTGVACSKGLRARK